MSDQDNKNENEVEKVEDTQVEVEDTQVEVEDTSKDDRDMRNLCFMCHRPESVAGKMIELPNNILRLSRLYAEKF